MSGSGKLYTPELLALSVELANYPAVQSLPFHGEARSPTCGSTLAMDLGLDPQGRIDRVGMRVRACAVGQAAAAIFARHAAGRDTVSLRMTQDQISAWLAGDVALPEWPDFALIAPARDYPGRHGAILLPWKAALAALSSASAAS